MSDNSLDVLDDLLGTDTSFEIDIQDPKDILEIPVEENKEMPILSTDDTPALEPDSIDSPENVDDEDLPVDDEDKHSNFEVVAKALFSMGKFAELPEGTKLNDEKFLELYDEFTKNKSKQDVQNFVFERHGQEGLDAFLDIFVKGAPIKEYLSAFQDETDVASIELDDNPYNQKSIVRRYLSDLDWEEGDIEEHIESLEQAGKLPKMATNYQSKMVEAQKEYRASIAKQGEVKQKEMQEAKQKRVSDITKAVQEALKSREISGIPLSIDDNKTLLHYVTADAYILPNGMPITTFDKDYLELKKDPVKFIALAKLVKEGLNIDPIKKSGVEELNKKAFDFKNKTEKRVQAKKTSDPNDLSWLFDLRTK